MMLWESRTHYRWLPNARDWREAAYTVAWPLRAALALFALFFGVCIIADQVAWEICKRQARELLRFRLEA